MSIYKRYASNVIIESIGSANTVTFQNTGGVANVIVTGDLTVTGNASLSGNISGDKLFNGTTSIEIQTSSGNANITVSGTSNVFVANSAGTITTGISSVTGNITGGNLNTASNISGGNLTISTGNIVLTQTSGATTAQMIQFTDANTAVTTLGANIGTIDWVTADATGLGPRTTASIRAVYGDNAGNANVLIQTNSTNRIVVIGGTGNVGVANSAPLHTFAVTGTGYVSSTLDVIGNVSGGNISTAGLATVTGNVNGGNLNTGGVVIATGNITGGNIITVGSISAGSAGILATGNIRGGNINSDAKVSATGNVYSGGGLETQGNISATGSVLAATAILGNANVTGNMFGTGIGVENIVWQSTTVPFGNVAMANVGSLGFLALAGSSYKFEAYMPVLPAGGTTTGFSTYFDAGTCYYTVEAQTTQTSAFSTSTSNVSGTATATQAMTGTTPRTVRLSGTIYSAGNANVTIQAQTSVSNIDIQSGSYFSYTRIG
jgi:filamentous hemagglutinin